MISERAAMTEETTFFTYDVFCEKLSSLCRRAGLKEQEDAVARKLYTVCTRLCECSRRFNLTAIHDPEEILRKHITDSLFFAAAIEKSGADSLIDIGSGAGFPSLPTAAVLPSVDVCALDSTAKKTVYMKETAIGAGISNFRSVAARAEEAGHTGAMRETFGAAGARAVANLRVLLELCTPFVRRGGVFVAMKGESAKEEAREAKSAAKLLGCELSDIAETYFLTQLERGFYTLDFYKSLRLMAVHNPENPQ